MSDVEPHKSGYMKPPKKNRFKKGQSGNPQGRPKTAETPYTVLRKVLKRKVRVKGADRKISIEEALIRQLRDLAISGDRRALALQQRIIEQANGQLLSVRPPVDLLKPKLLLAKLAGIDIEKDICEAGSEDKDV